MMLINDNHARCALKNEEDTNL